MKIIFCALILVAFARPSISFAESLSCTTAAVSFTCDNYNRLIMHIYQGGNSSKEKRIEVMNGGGCTAASGCNESVAYLGKFESEFNSVKVFRYCERFNDCGNKNHYYLMNARVNIEGEKIGEDLLQEFDAMADCLLRI